MRKIISTYQPENLYRIFDRLYTDKILNVELADLISHSQGTIAMFRRTPNPEKDKIKR
jgi:hypothetical protein